MGNMLRKRSQKCSQLQKPQELPRNEPIRFSAPKKVTEEDTRS